MKSLRTPNQLLLQSMLREARESAEQTQAELASRLSKPQSFVAKYEAGDRRLDVIELMLILRALSIDPARFVARLDKATKNQ